MQQVVNGGGVASGAGGFGSDELGFEGVARGLQFDNRSDGSLLRRRNRWCDSDSKGVLRCDMRHCSALSRINIAQMLFAGEQPRLTGRFG